MQYFAEASQKFTCPVVNAVDPAFTVAVSVTTVPEAIVVTGADAEVTASVVVVDALVCAAAGFQATHSATARITHDALSRLRRRERPLS